MSTYFILAPIFFGVFVLAVSLYAADVALVMLCLTAVSIVLGFTQ